MCSKANLPSWRSAQFFKNIYSSYNTPSSRNRCNYICITLLNFIFRFIFYYFSFQRPCSFSKAVIWRRTKLEKRKNFFHAVKIYSSEMRKKKIASPWVCGTIVRNSRFIFLFSFLNSSAFCNDAPACVGFWRAVSMKIAFTLWRWAWE